MKIAAALVLALVVVLTGSAHAVTLPITEGEIISGFFAFGDVFYGFGGNGFRVDGVIHNWWDGDVSSGVLFIPLISAPFVSVTVGGLKCDTLLDPNFSADCGSIELTNNKLLALDFNETLDTDRVPFRATGHLTLGDGFDIVGRGILEATWCRESPDCPSFEGLTIQYTFSARPAAVAEPPSLLLLLVGALTIVGLTIVRNSFSR
jgi:hypothetical protein